jgi:hypothetical protein
VVECSDFIGGYQRRLSEPFLDACGDFAKVFARGE